MINFLIGLFIGCIVGVVVMALCAINGIVANTSDVQEIVRCKDCRWRKTGECAMYYRCNCGEQCTWESDNDFCSYGVKKE